MVTHRHHLSNGSRRVEKVVSYEGPGVSSFSTSEIINDPQFFGRAVDSLTPSKTLWRVSLNLKGITDVVLLRESVCLLHVFRILDVLLAHDASVVDEVRRRRTSAAQGI